MVLGFKKLFVEQMPNLTLWIAAGVTAATGAAALLYWKRRSQFGAGTSTEVMKAKLAKTVVSSVGNRITRIPGVRKIIRERKMVFVVNRPMLMNKQLLFVSVSTACLRYYRSVVNNQDYYNDHIKPWTQRGQMKVVLKANSGNELQALMERCRAEGVEAVLLNLGDIPSQNNSEAADTKGKQSGNSASCSKEDPNTPVILCVLAPTEKLDQITGHLKLL